MRDVFERGRAIALKVAIALMLISGVTPLAGITSGVEHLPYGLAVAVLLGRRPSMPVVVTVGAASVFWTLSHFYWDDWTLWVYLVQFINILTPLVFFTSLRPQLERTAYIVFWAYIGFALLQWFGALSFADAVFENLLPRFRSGRENGYRGVASLESEPARAGFQMLMLYIIGRAKFPNQWVGLVALVLTQILLLRATIGLMLLAVLVGFLVIAEMRKRPKIAPVLLLGALLVAGGAYMVNPKIEVIVDTTWNDGLSGLNDTLVATSGGRFLALQDSLKDIARQPFGYGADPSYDGDVLELVEDEKYEASDGNDYKIERAARPVSAILNAVRTFGVAMALLVAWAIRSEFFATRRPDLNACFWFVIFSALFYGPSGSEALLIALGVAGGAGMVTTEGSETLEPVSGAGMSALAAAAPKLTVITIGRNSLPDLELTRASVMSQTYPNLHHLLIDGASTDGSAEVVFGYAQAEHTAAISQPDSGIYDAMNAALELVGDGYLLYLHAGDSFVDDHAIERAMTAISAAPEAPDLAIGWSRFMSEGQPLPYIVGAATPNAVTSAHESTIFSFAFHQHERYNTELKLGADYEFFRQLAGRTDLVVQRLNFTISNFAFGGRSNDPAYDGARFLERARIDAGFGEVPNAATYARISLRMMTRRVIYSLAGADRAAKLFLWLACRRGNSGARRLPIDQVTV